MNLKLIVVIFVIATMPVCAEAQTSDNATVTHARNILKIISGDKAKIIYCDMAEVFDQIERAGEKDTAKTDKLYRRMNELAKKLGPEYAALVYGVPKVAQEAEHSSAIAQAVSCAPGAISPGPGRAARCCRATDPVV